VTAHATTDHSTPWLSFDAALIMRINRHLDLVTAIFTRPEMTDYVLARCKSRAQAFPRVDPVALIGAIAVVIGATVVFGSNVSTSKQTAAAIKTAEALRAERALPMT
jgi:hypothetical protein